MPHKTNDKDQRSVMLRVEQFQCTQEQQMAAQLSVPRTDLRFLILEPEDACQQLAVLNFTILP